jgi:hypothetical protein
MQHPSMKSEKDAVHSALRQAIDEPTLTHARSLESVLRRGGTPAKVFGRLNQKSSIDAAAESDRGITERIANAFDASVTAARRLSGVHTSDASLTPRNAAERFLNPSRDAVVRFTDFGASASLPSAESLGYFQSSAKCGLGQDSLLTNCTS